jgi:hypothetical protein
LVSQTCQFDLACKATLSCLNCGQGFNLVLLPKLTGATCLACPFIANCSQCDYVNSYRCAICREGHFVDQNGYCSPCNDSCSACHSSLICTLCAPGYTLVAGLQEGLCLKCVSPCATCWGSPTHCTSCIASFTMLGRACRSDSRFDFQFTLANALNSDVLTNVSVLKQGCLQLLGSTN